MRRIRKHLTYANVMATLAVFLVLGGGAFAATQISGNDIKNRSIAGKKLMRHTVGRTELTRTLGFQKRVKWALVKANGTIVAQSGGISMSQDSNGDYYLNFGVNLKGKALLATAAEKFTSVGRVGVQTAPCGGGPTGASCPSTINDSKHVYVLTTDETQSILGQPEGFYIVAFP
jgi:hypothetical protein